ncbi:hypothetical protein CDL37_10105, partial [Escherichia coli]
MDIEFSQIHEMVYMHDIVNSDSKKKPRIPLKKFLNAEKVLTQTGFAPIFPDTCYHLTHYWLAAVDIPVASDNPVHYADAIRYN